MINTATGLKEVMMQHSNGINDNGNNEQTTKAKALSCGNPSEFCY